MLISKLVLLISNCQTLCTDSDASAVKYIKCSLQTTGIALRRTQKAVLSLVTQDISRGFAYPFRNGSRGRHNTGRTFRTIHFHFSSSLIHKGWLNLMLLKPNYKLQQQTFYIINRIKPLNFKRNVFKRRSWRNTRYGILGFIDLTPQSFYSK